MNNIIESSASAVSENSTPTENINSEAKNEEIIPVSSEPVASDSLDILDNSQSIASDAAVDSVSVPDLSVSLVDSMTTQQVVVVSPDNFMLKPLDEYTVTEACLLMLVAFTIFFGIFTLFTKRWW